MITGTVTLKPTTLPTESHAIYLLDYGTADREYEATLNGTTWEPVTPGALTDLDHSGTTLQVRVTLNLPEGHEPADIWWIVAYAT